MTHSLTVAALSLTAFVAAPFAAASESCVQQAETIDRTLGYTPDTHQSRADSKNRMITPNSLSARGWGRRRLPDKLPRGWLMLPKDALMDALQHHQGGG